MMDVLVAVILALLGAVHSSPVNIATLTSAENDVLQEAMVDELLIPSATTQMPKSNPSIQASQQASSGPEESGVIGSSSDHNAGDEESGSGMLEVDTDTASINEPSSSQTPDRKSRHGAVPGLGAATVSSITSGPASPALGPREVEKKMSLAKTGLYQENPPAEKELPQDAGKKTPGWIVILTCLVGVAVIAIVCVAVVTRERWHRPRQSLEPQILTGHEREKEMETFLHDDKPKEKGSVDEYTVVPLDELDHTLRS